MAERDEPVVVGRFTHLIDAELERSVLVGAGIACELNHQHLVGVMPHLSNAVGGVELWVKSADAEVARRLLAGDSDAADEPAPPEVAAGYEAPTLPSARDAQATRAFRSAVLGFFVAPVVLNAYSVWLLVTLRRAPGELSRRGRRHLGLAVAFNLMLGWIPLAVLAARR